ncbi:MAG: hypothetical protein NWE94_02160 [Candidatus Bathyarchaeota archaeon]|nr:hypothetical protein [Candidatus Bathyarchaeota archaeon]
MVTISYANNFLGTSLAENEYSAAKEFMLTTGLQVDDVAWTVGRAQTVRYSSRYGNVRFEPAVLNYTFEVTPVSGSPANYTMTTGIVLYNMPVSEITYGNNYFERIYPSNSSFLLGGSSAPVTHVFAVEKLPMVDGSYTRVVVAPSVRMLRSTVGGTTYVKFYLPVLNSGSNLYRSQSITLSGNGVTKITQSNVTQVKMSIAFTSASEGFTQDFFNLAVPSTLTFSPNTVVEFYSGEVQVSLGLHT